MTRAMRRELPHLHLDGQLDLKGLQAMIDLQQSLGAIKAPLKAAHIASIDYQPELTDLRNS
jgi:hypothetical protein